MAIRIIVTMNVVEMHRELAHIADIQKTDIELVGMAADGTELKSLLFDLHPDVVIADLEMPGDAVLDTVRFANQDGLGCKFIVISSRRQFEYVYNAMKAGVADYLLKPVELSELENALCKVIAELDTLHEKVGIDVDTARNAFLVKLRTQPELLPTELPEVNGRYCTNFKQGLFLPLFIKLDFCKDTVDFRENLFAPQREIRRYLDELLKPLCFDVLTELRQVALDALLCFPAENQRKVHSALPDLLHMAQRAAASYNSATVTIAVGETINSFAEIDSSWDRMADAMWLRMFRGMGTVLSYSDVPALTVEESSKLITLRMMAVDALGRVNFSDFERTLAEFFSLPKAALSHHEARIWSEETLENFFKINDEVLSRFSSPGQLLSDTQRMLNLSSSYREYASIYMSRLKELSTRIEEANRGRLKKAVRKAINYVEAHYSEHLGIENISYEVGLSPVYFSHLFKRDVGRNFTDFVTEFRMNSAKERLLSTSDGIGEIAETVGYLDQRYFSRQFKKFTGVTPSVYRSTFGDGK